MGKEEFPKIQCETCKDVIQSRYSGDWVCCSCFRDGVTGCYIDSTEHYTRWGGGPFLILNEEGLAIKRYDISKKSLEESKTCLIEETKVNLKALLKQVLTRLRGWL